GYTGCTSGNYARKHNPWVNFTNVSSGTNLTFHEFPADYSRLPTVSFVVPNLCNDMHDCSVATGDTWLKNNLDDYVQWGMTHNSLFVLTFDEGSGSDSTNHITTIFVGPMVLPGDYGTRIDHYTVLRTLEELYGLAPTGNAASASTILDIWQFSRIPVVPPGRSRRPVVVPFPLATGSEEETTASETTLPTPTPTPTDLP
ncbi:MAG TPA: alkaline phosphatase family protein, partial [Thermoanaerobaculia bacterium]